MIKHIVEDEDLNLQDLIFILLFFFIIAQTLIVFKMQKDVLVPPKVDDKIKKTPEDKDIDLMTVIIDNKSNIYTLIKMHGRTSVIKGFDDPDPAKYPLYCDPLLAKRGKDEFLPSEKADANKKIVEKLIEIKNEVGFEKPQLGLIADHRARYGTIFQVNMAITELITKEEVMDEVKWKIQEEGTQVPDEAEEK
jgi:hypothetical protein